MITLNTSDNHQLDYYINKQKNTIIDGIFSVYNGYKYYSIPKPATASSRVFVSFFAVVSGSLI